MKNTFKYLMIILLGFSLNSCYYDSDAEYDDYRGDNNGGNNGGDTPTDLTYTDDIATIFGFCSSCHTASLSPDLREENAYNNLVPDYVTPNDAEGSSLYTKLNDGHQNLTSSEIALVKAWIDQGAIE